MQSFEQWLVMQWLVIWLVLPCHYVRYLIWIDVATDAARGTFKKCVAASQQVAELLGSFIAGDSPRQTSQPRAVAACEDHTPAPVT
jgi:hypothetical protein